MSWQEELRRLDAAFAAGDISGSEHRRRREDVLAEASGAPLVAAGQPASSAPTTEPAAAESPGGPAKTAGPNNPDNPDVPSSPDGSDNNALAAERVESPSDTTADSGEPAPSDDGRSEWRTTNPARPESSTGSPEPAAAALLSSVKPTTAPSPADERPTELMRFPDLSAPPPSYAVSGTAHARRTGRTWVAISAAVFVALGAVLGGAWWLGQGESDPASATSEQPQGLAEPALEDLIPALPGVPGTNDSTLAVDKGVELGLYPEHSADILTDHGVDEVLHRASTDGDTGYFLLAIPASDPERATSLAEELGGMTLDAGFTALDGFEGGLTGELGERDVRGTWYASGPVAVNLWVSQSAPADTDELAALTDQAVKTLHEALPPS